MLSSWIAMTVIFIVSVPNANINTILYPSDYQGSVCGHSGQEGGYLMYTDLRGNGVCVSQCSNVTSLNPTSTADLSCKYGAADNGDSVQVLLATSKCLPLYDAFSLLHRCIPRNPLQLLQTTNAIVGLNETK